MPDPAAFDWAPLLSPIGPIVGAALALLGVGVKGRMDTKTAERLAESAAVRARTDARVKQRKQQLDELYAPLEILLAHTKGLSLTLRSGWSDDDRAVNKIAEVKRDENRRVALEEILATHARIEQLLVNKAGLLHQEHAPLVVRFMRHWRYLNRAYEGKSVPAATDEDAYPRELDANVNGYASKLRKEIESALAGES